MSESRHSIKFKLNKNNRRAGNPAEIRTAVSRIYA
jgi:hypothetical protein